MRNNNNMYQGSGFYEICKHNSFLETILVWKIEKKIWFCVWFDELMARLIDIN